MNKRLFSMFLALCMIVSMLPVSAMAEEIHTTVGGSGEIISFAPLTETEKTVSPGKSGEDLELPETLTATVRTAVPADENPVQDSGSPQTATPATTTEPEWVENTVEIPVTWVSLDYDMNTEGEYVFTPVVEGYTVSVPLPEIVVTVGEVPPIAAARGLATPMSTTNYGIWVGGVEVTSANKDNIAGMGITGNVTYDSDTNTLTLNDANITGCYTAGNYDYGIYHSNSSMVNNLIINLVGTNTITLNARELQTVAGIYSEQSEGSLTFCETGSGSLSISAPNMAIYGENAITISSGTINATGGPVGIYSRGQMTINGGNVTAGGTSYGIGCNNSLSITSGTLTATSGTHAIVFTDGSLSASDGMQVTASANENGTNQETYNAANLANYKYIKVEPGATSSVPTEVGDRTALQSAISDAAGDLNLKLSDSYSDTGTITIPSTFIHNITIDLNGKTLNGGSAAAITHQGDGTLTITDSSSGGTVTSTTNSQGTIAVVNGGTVELLGGTVSNSNSAGGAAVYTQNATLNIRGGVVSAAGDGGVAVWDSSSSILNIYGGMLSAAGSSGNAVYSTNVDSRLNISGGTISAASNIAIYHQNTTIKTGTIIIQGGTKAMQSAPTLESGVQGMASTNIDGNDSVAYNVADLATYKYIKVEPAAVTPVPTVTSVSVPTYDTYLSGENLNFTVTFDKNVTVNTSSGTPYLSLTIGSASRHADYVSGSGTNLVFRYTVQAGDSDTNGISIDSLTLNGGTIQDSTGNDANLTLNGVGDVTGVLVNPPAPSISVQPSPQTVNEGQSATFSVTATGTGLTYQWQVNTGSNFTTITDGGVYSGASTSTLNITRATAGMNGYLYRIVVIGTYSPIATSNSARLTVNAAPSYTITANPTTKDFGSLSAGYSAPAAQTVTITNTGNSSLTLTQP
ncbi:beta strand repeat-containing protein, partial [Oscillibacter sp. GMB15532]|uniref:beta strand repeat-containing protein n=1 Tax=Oscillibacter sp. GMB15532 TaxID=3230022 RepID=UPI0034DF865D